MKRFVMPVILAALLAVPAVGQEKVTIKIKKHAQGNATQTTENESEKGVMSFTVMGMAQKKDEDKSSTSSYQEVILQKENGKRVTKAKRTYEKAEGTRDGKKITPSYVGKEVLIERTGAAYKFSVDGKELMGEDLILLADEFKDKKKEDDFSIEDLLLPKQPVAVNESWKPDVAAVAKELSKDGGMIIDSAKSTSTGKLLKAYKKDGRQYGVIEIELNMVMTKIAAGPSAIELNPGSMAKVTLRFDGCIDGSANSGTMDMTMEMKMVGALKTADGIEVKIDANLKKTGVKTSVDLGEKK